MKAIDFDALKIEARLKQINISEELMMEHAGAALAKAAKGYKKVLILLGGGNNAADGLVAARILKNAHCIELITKQNKYYKLQKQRALGVCFVNMDVDLKNYDCIIDCIFGTGLSKAIDFKLASFIEKINTLKAYKIACDLPSGLGFGPCFRAHLTLCMGVRKARCYEDFAKEYVGKIACTHLGHRGFFQNTRMFECGKKELLLIKRTKASNKGNFGHIFIAASDSAGSLAGLGALAVGAGKVSLLADHAFSPLLVKRKSLESDAKVYALGMGLDELCILKESFLKKKSLVLDASCFKSPDILPLLDKKDTVITPHPKEFCKLYELAFKRPLSLASLQANRLEYAREFSKSYPCVLILKGANTIVAKNGYLFIINIGKASLAKAGSGDVLAGMVAANLASFNPLRASINAVYAHAKASKYGQNINAFDALKLIKNLAKLGQKNART